ncbi:MAG: NACHT domain-containing protein, partial [Candidatus Promineifilaceae bacterium]
DKLFILGKPGAGKTTFMKWVALQAIQRKLDYFPIFINLKTLSDKRPGLNSAENILDYIARTPEVRRIPSPKTFIEYALESGKALILFDGLDEVNLEDDLRSNMVDALNEFVAEYGDGKTLITCRVAATEYSFTPFEYVEMADFTPQQMGTFINNWFADDKDKAKRCHAELVDRSDNKALQELAQVPLLMTLLCLTFDELNAFPIKRSQIYDEATRALLSKWDASRNIRRDTIYRGLDLQEKKWMLAAVASHTFERGDYFVEEGEMAALLEDALRSIPNIENPDGEVVLKAIEAQHGILVERARRIHSFSHLTLQEYFTALNIVENARHKNYLPALMEHITDSRWREVFLLTAGMLRSAEDFFELFDSHLRKLIDSDNVLKKLFQNIENLRTREFSTSNKFVIRSLILLITIAFEAIRILSLNNSDHHKAILDTLFNIHNHFIPDSKIKNNKQASALDYMVRFLSSIWVEFTLVSKLSYFWLGESTYLINKIADKFEHPLSRYLVELISVKTVDKSVKKHTQSLVDLVVSQDQQTDQSTLNPNVDAIFHKFHTELELDQNWLLNIQSCRLLASYLEGMMLFADCLQVANIRERMHWINQLLLLPQTYPITTNQGPSYHQSQQQISRVRIAQATNLTQLRRWLLINSNSTEFADLIDRRIRFLEEKQRIFYVELPLTLRGAFSVAEFRVLLRTRCGRALDDYSLANSFRVMVVDVIEAAEREGWLVELVEQAYVTNSSNRLLKETHHEMQAFLNEFDIDQL